MSPIKPPLEVVCAVILDNDRILAARRSQSMSHPGQWEFPGGKIEPEEKLEDAIAREIREELGINVIPQTILTPVVHAYPHRIIRLTPIICTLSGDQTPHPHEHDRIEWVLPDDLKLLDWCEADIPIVEEVLVLRSA